jgi:hypothetical protein
MSALTVDDFPLNEWRRHDTARCPEDGTAVELRRRLVAKPLGTFSLAGHQLKFSAAETWDARCTSCAWTGPAALK